MKEIAIIKNTGEHFFGECVRSGTVSVCIDLTNPGTKEELFKLLRGVLSCYAIIMKSTPFYLYRYVMKHRLNNFKLLLSLRNELTAETAVNKANNRCLLF